MLTQEIYLDAFISFDQTSWFPRLRMSQY